MGAAAPLSEACSPPRTAADRGGLEEAHPEAIRVQGTVASFLLPLAAGGVLATYDPKLAMGAGGLMLVVAAAYKKDWRWWIAGLFILAMGIFIQWTKQSAKE